MGDGRNDWNGQWNKSMWTGSKQQDKDQMARSSKKSKSSWVSRRAGQRLRGRATGQRRQADSQVQPYRNQQSLASLETNHRQKCLAQQQRQN